MPSQIAMIWAFATGATVVVAGTAAAYWAHPSFLWPNSAPVAVTERAPPGFVRAKPAAPGVHEASLSPAPAAKQAAPASPPPALDKPAFDVVSVQPTGETVVAGRAAPNAKVELRDAGKTVGEATANAEGQFVIIPPPLPPGQHSLALAAGAGPSAQTSNAITVAVAAPSPPSAASAAVLSSPASSATAPPRESGPDSRVAVQSIEASSGGRLVARGAAGPNAVVRLYLSGAYVGDVKTGADGRWSLTINHGITPGAYDVRADEISPADAKVAARAEAPFDYNASAAPAGLPSSPAAGAASPADLVLDSIQTHHVDAGNTLWGISQKFYGDGARYEIIFAANSGQIRNPSLIYPGQTFVIPRPEPKP
jgi:nucleoid-associated protein YgaU